MYLFSFNSLLPRGTEVPDKMRLIIKEITFFGKVCHYIFGCTTKDVIQSNETPGHGVWHIVGLQ